MRPPDAISAETIEGFDALSELAMDMRWAWNHYADKIWQELDPELWELTHNPWVCLQTISKKTLQQALANPEFRNQVDALVQAKNEAEGAPGWFQEAHPQSPLTSVAYFSMEFMLSEALPIYSGGLGNVAGDQLKAASDLGVPVIGIGLLYQQGYFRQVIDKQGAQLALYPYNDPGQLPISPLRNGDGEWLRLRLDLPGYPVWLRTWQVQVGRVKLYLLDTNDIANLPAHRGITSELYTAEPELRLKQEMVLGIGGWRLLSELGIRPEVCHLNEGHAAFAVLERARLCMKETGQPFEVALAATRAGNLFTTHTPVAAGFDRFAPFLIEQHMAGYAAEELGLTMAELLALGRLNPDDPAEPFNMAYLALRGSGAVNGVSRLHGKVSRWIFEPLFPRWPRNEVPVAHITNGTHMPSWDSAIADDIWTEACGKNRWLGTTEDLQQHIRRIPDTRLSEMRSTARKSLVEYARKRLARQLAACGAPAEEVEQGGHLFDFNVLTLGFARRFTGYKRPTLLLNDPDRLLRLLSHPERPVQLIIAGKAHPRDYVGQALIQEWTRFIRQPAARTHAIFLSDYDMLLTEQMVQGVDVWLNTPRRPWEACGTSGMKVLVNGGINLSELDGWWAEAYTPDVGWALGDRHEHPDDPGWDQREAEALYDLLEREIIPEFYAGNEGSLSPAWLARMRESMAQLTPVFSANRAVRQYTEQQYLPAAAAYRERVADHAAGARHIVEWRRSLEEKWKTLRFVAVRVTTAESHQFEIEIELNGLDPAAVSAELYADGGSDAPFRQMLTRVGLVENTVSAYLYRGDVPTQRPAEDYTARLISCCQGVTVPLEAAYILWQK